MSDLKIYYPRTPERVAVLDPEDKKESVGRYAVEVAWDEVTSF